MASFFNLSNGVLGGSGVNFCLAFLMSLGPLFCCSFCSLAFFLLGCVDSSNEEVVLFRLRLPSIILCLLRSPSESNSEVEVLGLDFNFSAISCARLDNLGVVAFLLFDLGDKSSFPTGNKPFSQSTCFIRGIFLNSYQDLSLSNINR